MMDNIFKTFLLIWLFIGTTDAIAKIHITVELGPDLAAEAANEGRAHILQKEENSSLGFLNPVSSFQITSEHNIFQFVFENETRYVNIAIPFMDDTRYPDAFFLINTLLESGDSVHIYFEDRDNLTVSGINWQKYKWYLEAQALGFKGSDNVVGFDQNPKIWLEQIYRKLQDRLDLLQEYKPELSPYVYKVIEADLVGLCHLEIYKRFRENRFGHIFNDSIGEQGISLYKQKLYKNKEVIENEVMLEQSAFYASYLMQKTWSDNAIDWLFEGKPFTDSFLDRIIEKYPAGILRDNVLVAYLYRDHLELNEEFYRVKENLLVTEKYKKVVDKISVLKQLASKVDSTMFRDKNGDIVRLTDFKGKVLYLDFWFTGCAGCVNVAKALPQVEKAFEGRDDMVFISISIDSDKNKWLKSIKPLPENRPGTRPVYSHFVTDNTIYLYTDGKREDISILKNFNKVGTYPFMMVVDQNGDIITDNPPRPDGKSKNDLVTLLTKVLNMQFK